MSNNAQSWMLYGANGYTGQLTAELAKRRGFSPILAGRSEEKVRPLAERLGMECRIFGLDDAREVQRNIEDIAAVLHQAGPFSATSVPMVDACLAVGAHYLDITGEIAVFEAVLGRDADAKAAGCVLMPGVGFDVVPTDCMAAMLAAEMPDATSLELAFASLGGGASAGTTKTMVEGLGEGGAARIDGKIVQVPSAWKVRQVPFPSKERMVVSIPWGDVSTAYYTTGIPNITTYMAFPPRSVPMMRGIDRLKPVLRNEIVQKALKKMVEWVVSGPSDEELEAGRTEVWGTVSNAEGESISATLVTPQGYAFTADSALRATLHLLAGKVEPGATTPAKGLGKGFVSEMDGVEVSGFVRH